MVENAHQLPDRNFSRCKFWLNFGARKIKWSPYQLWVIGMAMGKKDFRKNRQKTYVDIDIWG